MKCLLCGFCGTVGNMKHICGWRNAPHNVAGPMIISDDMGRLAGALEESRAQVAALTAALGKRDVDEERNLMVSYQALHEMLTRVLAPHEGDVQIVARTAFLSSLASVQNRIVEVVSALQKQVDHIRAVKDQAVEGWENAKKRADQLEEELAIYEGIHCAVCLGGLGNDEADEPKGLCSSACAESYAAQFSGDLTKQLAELREVLQASDNKNAHERAIKMRRQLESLREDRDEQKKTAEARLQQLNRQGVAFGEQLAELREENEKLREQAAAEGKSIQRERLKAIDAVVRELEGDFSDEGYAEERRAELGLVERIKVLYDRSTLKQYNDVVRERYAFQQENLKLRADLAERTRQFIEAGKSIEANLREENADQEMIESLRSAVKQLTLQSSDRLAALELAEQKVATARVGLEKLEKLIPKAVGNEDLLALKEVVEYLKRPNPLEQFIGGSTQNHTKETK